MISRSLVCSQGSVDSVLADHFLPRPWLSAPLSKQKTGPRVWRSAVRWVSWAERKYIVLLQKISSLEIQYIFWQLKLKTWTWTKLTGICCDSAWPSLAGASWRLGLAALPQLRLSRAGPSCQLSSPGAGSSCQHDSLCQIKWSSLSEEHQAAESVHPLKCTIARPECRGRKNICRKLLRHRGHCWLYTVVTRPRVLPVSESCLEQLNQ